MALTLLKPQPSLRTHTLTVEWHWMNLSSNACRNCPGSHSRSVSGVRSVVLRSLELISKGSADRPNLPFSLTLCHSKLYVLISFMRLHMPVTTSITKSPHPLPHLLLEWSLRRQVFYELGKTLLPLLIASVWTRVVFARFVREKWLTASLCLVKTLHG